jgi:predicted metalloprotease with PDZ domain
MSRLTTHTRPLLRIVVPVTVATALVALALVNVFLVRDYQQKAAVDDGVFWTSDGGAAVKAFEVAPGSPADVAGIRRGDTLFAIDGRPVESPEDVQTALANVRAGGAVTYSASRGGVNDLITVRVALSPGPPYALYNSLASVGIFGLLVGASVRLRRPAYTATLHFYWLTVAFFWVFYFTPT